MRRQKPSDKDEILKWLNVIESDKPQLEVFSEIEIDYQKRFGISDLESIESINVTQDGNVSKRIVRKGNGSLPSKGFQVQVRYIARLLPSRKAFDLAYSPLNKSCSLHFELGAGQVIESYDLTVATMQKGEACVMTTDAKYAYGELGCPPRIPPQSSLEFHIELVGFEQTEGKVELSLEERIAESNRIRTEGNEHFKKGSFRKATKSYNRAMGIFEGLNDLTEDEEEIVDRAKLPLYTNLATSYLRLNESLKVIQNATKALQIDPQNVKAFWRLGRAQLDEGQYFEARSNLTNAAKLEPQNKEIRKDLEELQQDEELEQRLERERPNPMRGMFNKPNP